MFIKDYISEYQVWWEEEGLIPKHFERQSGTKILCQTVFLIFSKTR